MIDYRKKITVKRKYTNKRNPLWKDINEATESNRGRIVNSPAVRRLQQKTQVFPLEINAAVRSRLTHSLEVQQNARYLARTIIGKLKKQNKIKKYKLKGLEHSFISIAEMASLMHDIGNPPFGHFGELAINEWMTKTGVKCCNISLNIKDDLLLSENMQKLKNKIEKDIINFEGNAQGIRIIHSLQALNLTYSQIASILKYTRPAYSDKPAKLSKFSYLKKKPGYYLSEELFIKKLYKKLSMSDGCRFPVTYIMEAADDIAYGIADLEDAVDKGIMSLKKLYESIIIESKKFGKKGKYISSIAKDQYKKAKGKKLLKVNSFIIGFRTQLVNELIHYASKIFIKNHKAIFNGNYNKALLEDNNSKYDVALEVLKNVALQHVFKNHEVEILELKGNAAIKGLLNCYKPILTISMNEFELLVTNKKNKTPIASRLFHRLSNKYIDSYIKIIDDLKKKDLDKIELNLYEWYYRSRLLLDFVSGMTDEYALKEYQILSAIK